jgi:hypothetical protein
MSLTGVVSEQQSNPKKEKKNTANPHLVALNPDLLQVFSHGK